MIEKLLGTNLKFNLELVSKITFVGKKAKKLSHKISKKISN